MNRSQQVEEFLESAEREGRISTERAEIMRRLASPSNTVVVHPGSVRADDLYREIAPLLGGTTLVVSPSRRRSAREGVETGSNASILRIKLDDFTEDLLRERQPPLIVIEGLSRDELTDIFIQRLDDVAKPADTAVLILTEHGERKMLRRLVQRLSITAEDVFYLDFFRPGLLFDVVRAPGDENKRKLAVRLAAELQGSGIVFCESTKLARELALDMHEAGVDARLIHGQTRARERNDALNEFSNDRARVLIATESVTLPRSKNDIRFVLHCGLPDSLETYYDQVLLAGADGKQARAVLLFDRTDKNVRNMANLLQAPLLVDVLRVRATVRDAFDDIYDTTLNYTAEHAGIPLKKARAILQLLKEAGAIVEEAGTYRNVPEVDEAQVAEVLSQYRARREEEHRQAKEVLNFAESRLCRNKVLHRYFGLDDVPACGLCDNCRRGTERKVRLKAQRRREAAAVRNAPGAQPGGTETPQWGRGDLVVHDKWGEGEVKQVWGDKLRIHFPGSGEKVIRSDFVNPA